MEMLGIKVKQYIKDDVKNCAYDQTSVSQEYIIPLELGKVTSAPAYAAFLNNKFVIMDIQDDRVIVKFNGEVICIKSGEVARSEEERVESLGAYRTVYVSTTFEIVYQEEKTEEELQMEENIYDTLAEKYENEEYDQCLVYIQKLISMKQTEKNYNDVLDMRLDVVDLNNKLNQSYLNYSVAELAVIDIEESNLGNREKMEIYREVSKIFRDLNSYERAEYCLRKALELTDDKEKQEAILIQFYNIALRRMADAEAYIAGHFYNGVNKLPDMKQQAREEMNTVRHDPIESSRQYLEVVEDVEDKVLKMIGPNSGPGYNHLYWRKKAQILKEEYKIEWKSPRFMNPNTRFD